jgi:CRISPR system Cascade subunit CasE
MYLSKLSLLQSTHSARELAKLGANGVYAAHQMLWQLFTNENERNFLFREEIGPSGLPIFFVLSKTQPLCNQTLFDVQTKPFQPQLSVGQRLAYKLRVNPTVCMKNDAGGSKRHDVLMHAKYQVKEDERQNKGVLKAVMDEAAHKWISEPQRLKRWGIQLDVLPEIEAYTQHRSQKKSGNQIRFSSVDVEGMLTVKDPTVFVEQYVSGFGRAKAFGCGLMLIRSIN